MIIQELDTAEKSIAQRSLDGQYPASRLSECLVSAYWLAACHEDQAEYMALARMEEAQERLIEVAAAMGYRLVPIGAEMEVG